MSHEVLPKGKDLTGTEIEFRTDAYGRQLLNSYYVRGITTTASASITRVLETTIMAGNSTNTLDLCTFTAVNATGVALQVNLRSGTGGSIIDSIFLAANSSATRNYNPPLPQNEQGQAWTAQTTQSGDISDSPITITMLATRNPNTSV